MSLKQSIFVCLVLVFSIGAHAEEATPQVWNIQSFRLNPGTQPVFEQIVMKYKEAAEKVGSPPWYGYSPAIGNDFVYDFATPVASFAMFAEQNDIVLQAFGEEEAMKIAEMARISIADLNTFIIVQRPDLSIPGPEMTEPPEATIAYAITLKNGVEAEWEAWMKQLIEVTKETSPDATWNAFWGGLGAQNLFGIRANVKWADMDNPAKSVPQRLVEVYGERKGMRMYKDAIGLIESVETSVSRFRADLSHMPAAEE